KGVAAECSETTGIRAGSAGDADGNRKEGTVVCSAAEVIFAYRATGGKVWNCNLVRPVRAACSNASLLNPRKNAERRPAGQRGDVENLPAAGDALRHNVEKCQPVKGQALEDA